MDLSKPVLIATSLLCVLCAVGLAFIAYDIATQMGGGRVAAGTASAGAVAFIGALFILLLRRRRRPGDDA